MDTQPNTDFHSSVEAAFEMQTQTNTEFDSLVEAEPSADHHHKTDIRSKQSLWHRRLWRGWRKIVFLGVVCNVLVFLFNCFLLAWAASHDWSVWQGSHDDLERHNAIVLLAINIVSTIILAGSNSTLQILLAPTRKGIDQAHHNKQFLDIGISSLHNWRYLPWQRRLLSIVLLITTLPTHLLYNSMTVPTIAKYDIASAGLVTKDFLQIPPSNSSLKDVWLSASGSSASNWTRANATDWPWLILSEMQYEHPNVLFFTNLNAPLENSTWYYELHYSPESCGPFNISLNGTQISDTALSIQRSWIGSVDNISAVFAGSTNLYNPCAAPFDDNSTYIPAFVDYCLFQTAPILSKVELIPQVLVVLIVSNLVRIVISSILLSSNFEPLLTIGDTIASFLDTPDSTTRYIGPISATTLQKKISTLEWPFTEKHVHRKAWKVRERYYTDTVTRLRWGLTLGFCLVYILAIIGVIIWVPLLKISSDSQNRLEDVARGAVVTPSGMSFSRSILLVNLPQFALAGTYLGYNALFTCMLLSKEWLNYSKHKKSLRVSNPHGKQRGSYFLSVPYKYSVPLVMKNVLLHWILSQSMFVVQIDIYGSDLTPNPANSQHYIGVSQIALMLSAILAAAFIVVPVYFGKRKLGTAMPLVRSNSLAISAACQPVTAGLSVEELRYGVISKLPSGIYRLGFSDKEVKPIVAGQVYE